MTDALRTTYDSTLTGQIVINPDGSSISGSGAGAVSMGIMIDGVLTALSIDTATPANSVPLQVELINASGITADFTNAEINVQLDATGAQPDSVRIGDGTEELLINADGSIILGNTLGALVCGTGADSVQTLRVTLSDDAKDTAHPIQTQVGDGTNQMTVNADGSINVNTGGGTISKVDLITNDYTITPITTAAYVELIASTSGDINSLDIFDSSGQTLVLATGAAASEVDILYINPGGNGVINIDIASGTRLSAKAIGTNATVGRLNITAFS